MDVIGYAHISEFAVVQAGCDDRPVEFGDGHPSGAYEQLFKIEAVVQECLVLPEVVHDLPHDGALRGGIIYMKPL